MSRFAGDTEVANRLRGAIAQELGRDAFECDDARTLERVLRVLPPPPGAARRIPRLEVVSIEVRTSEEGGAERPLDLVLSALRDFPSADVVIAPEWFFLPHDRLSHAAELAAIRWALERATRGTRTLVVPGTVAWRDARGAYRNTAIAVSGGRTLAMYDKCHDGGDADLALQRGARFRPGTGVPIFRWRGLDVGLETCRDHGDGLLRRRLLASARDCVDLHLILSAGVGPRHVAAGVGGVVVHADGNTLGDGTALSTVYRRVGPEGRRARQGTARRLPKNVTARQFIV